jgi:hypothetical protein
MWAAATSAGGVPGAMISRTDRATAAADEAGSASMTGFSVRCRVPAGSAPHTWASPRAEGLAAVVGPLIAVQGGLVGE